MEPLLLPLRMIWFPFDSISNASLPSFVFKGSMRNWEERCCRILCSSAVPWSIGFVCAKDPVCQNHAQHKSIHPKTFSYSLFYQNTVYKATRIPDMMIEPITNDPLTLNMLVSTSILCGSDAGLGLIRLMAIITAATVKK